MNFLSILIYGADVLSNLQPLFVIAAIVMLAVTLGGSVIFALAASETASYSYNDKNEYHKIKDGRTAASRKLIKFIWVPLLLGILAALMPQQSTVYLIAGSELAEAGYKTELGQKLTTIVNEKIETYLDDVTAEKITEKFNINGLTQEEKNALMKRLTGETN